VARAHQRVPPVPANRPVRTVPAIPPVRAGRTAPMPQAPIAAPAVLPGPTARPVQQALPLRLIQAVLAPASRAVRVAQQALAHLTLRVVHAAQPAPAHAARLLRSALPVPVPPPVQPAPRINRPRVSPIALSRNSSPAPTCDQTWLRWRICR